MGVVYEQTERHDPQEHSCHIILPAFYRVKWPQAIHKPIVPKHIGQQPEAHPKGSSQYVQDNAENKDPHNQDHEVETDKPHPILEAVGPEGEQHTGDDQQNDDEHVGFLGLGGVELEGSEFGLLFRRDWLQGLRVLEFLRVGQALEESEFVPDLIDEPLEPLLLNFAGSFLQEGPHGVDPEVLDPHIHAVCVLELKPSLAQETHQRHHLVLMSQHLLSSNLTSLRSLEPALGRSLGLTTRPIPRMLMLGVLLLGLLRVRLLLFFFAHYIN